jgi:interleukin-1 receptor-associated kinase 1
MYVCAVGASFPAEQLHESEVSAFRQAETQIMNRAMAKYRAICSKVKVAAVCKVETVPGDGDVAQGILRLVAQNGIRRLVVGAAADKRYSSRMRAPSSRTAVSVQQQAHPLCAIWFLCKGNLVCTRPPAAAVVADESHGGQQAAGAGQQPPASVGHRRLCWDDDHHHHHQRRQQQEEDIQSIFAEAQVLRRERERRDEQVAALEAQLASSKRVIQDLQEKLSEAHCLVFTLEREQEELRRRYEELRDRLLPEELVELSYEELMEATQNLDESLRLGQGQGHGHGGYGTVYRAVLQKSHGAVAIKVLTNNQNQHALQQVEALRQLRHPNVVPLLGACSAPQAPALVYEYLPAGSLDDRLVDRKNPLLWPERTRIAAEVRSALVFLHGNGVVHGHLKPPNVLLTASGSSKLADSGLCLLLEPDVLLHCTLRSADTVAYVDPEFLTSGELRPTSDAYAFGVLLLRLLTGRPPMGLARHVRAALGEGRVADILDASAGDWPYTTEQADQLAHLALSCCEMASHNRPDLAGEMVAHTLQSFLQNDL